MMKKALIWYSVLWINIATCKIAPVKPTKNDKNSDNKFNQNYYLQQNQHIMTNNLESMFDPSSQNYYGKLKT